MVLGVGMWDLQVLCSSLSLQCQQELSTRARSASESSTASLEEDSQTSSDSPAEELEGTSEDKVSGLQAAGCVAVPTMAVSCLATLSQPYLGQDGVGSHVGTSVSVGVGDARGAVGSWHPHLLTALTWKPFLARALGSGGSAGFGPSPRRKPHPKPRPQAPPRRDCR